MTEGILRIDVLFKMVNCSASTEAYWMNDDCLFLVILFVYDEQKTCQLPEICAQNEEICFPVFWIWISAVELRSSMRAMKKWPNHKRNVFIYILTQIVCHLIDRMFSTHEWSKSVLSKHNIYLQMYSTFWCSEYLLYFYNNFISYFASYS